MHQKPVFYDPTGRRPRALFRLSAALGIFAAVSGTLFVVSLLFIPLLPRIAGFTAPFLRIKRPILPNNLDRRTRFLLKKERTALWHEIAKPEKPILAAPHGSNIVAAFYVPWQSDVGLPSLKANADNLTHLMPEFLHLDSQGQGIDFTAFEPQTNPANEDALNLARAHHLQIHPILTNSLEGVFDESRVHKLLKSPAAQLKLAGDVRDWLVAQKFQGLNLDLEDLNAHDYEMLPSFLRLLSDTLHDSGLELSMDIEADNDDVPLHTIAQICDFVVLMAYDEHSEGGNPGPIASIGWYNHVLQRALNQVPSQKLVMGIGNYAYDWTLDQHPTKDADALTYQSALILARDNWPDKLPKDIVDFDDDALNSDFNYYDDDEKLHEVWMLDAVSAFNQWQLAKRAHVRGSALWVLGSEDPDIWQFLNRRDAFRDVSPQKLATVTFPYEVEPQGQGEILTVISEPQQGNRHISIDAHNGMCTDMYYQHFPSSYVIQQSGYHPKEIALTFDDGPSAPYTGQILDVLNSQGVHGTFFEIGENMEMHPSLVHRVFDEGNEIGSHTFTHPNIGEVSDRRARLELNTTQRALQSIIHRSTIMFRPPYAADAEPSTPEEVKPVIIASQMGYVTIGESLDPQDWNLYKVKDGQTVPRTESQLLDDIRQEVHNPDVLGNMLLLHDGGGDRSQTVAALKVIIPELKKEGYRFVTVSDLMGKTRDAVMPPVSARDLFLIGVDRFIFETIFSTETILTIAFIAAIALGIGRVLFVTPLALIYHQHEQYFEYDPLFHPTVSILIAAYNESAVIERTINSILHSDYDDLEIVVVDDGSSDGTGDFVETVFGDNPHVRLFRQANSGKATALNLAIAESRGEILIGLDADTQFAASTISLLVRHFEDPQVGAVAGNVKVGNRINLLTRWQTIEYITSQNLDRRAYALLNAVTVVPGAVGAWRRAAVVGAGGYVADTLAEDMDLTWRLRRAGWRITSDSAALAYTEAPDNMRNFFKQRFRWAYGTLQCLYKQRKAVFHCGWFGWLALPTLWLFQVLFQVLAPLVDLNILYSLYVFMNAWIGKGVLTHDWQPLPYNTHLMVQAAFFYSVLFVTELVGATVAFLLDGERLSLLWYLFWQRFVYRQLMYAVIWKSLWMAINGIRQGWGKMQRKGTVHMEEVPLETPR